MQRLPGGLGKTLPRTADAPRVKPEASSDPFRRDGTARRSFLSATPAPGRSIPFRKKLRTPHRAALSSVRYPGGATHNLSRALRRPPSQHQDLRTKMSGRVTGQLPPGPTPGPATRAASVPRSCAAIRGREHGRRAAPAREGGIPPRTHRQLSRHSGEARGG